MSGMRRRFAEAAGWVGARKLPAASSVVALAALGLYLGASVRGGFAPGSPLGLAFGIGAVVVLLLVMLYSARRGLPRARALGPRRGYMQLHLWGGGLFLLLLLVHSDFRLPAGVLTFALWAVSLWVVLTGIVGLLLQRTIPRVLGSTAPLEVNLHRIPDLVSELRRRAEEATAVAEPRLRNFYQQEFAPEMAEPRMVGTALLRRPGDEGPRAGAVEILRSTLPEESAATLDELQELHRAKHEMDVHFTLQRIMRGWLFLHLPMAIILLGLVALHVFFILYF